MEVYFLGKDGARIDHVVAARINGKKLEIISRDDGANPGDAVRVVAHAPEAGALTSWLVV